MNTSTSLRCVRRKILHLNKVFVVLFRIPMFDSNARQCLISITRANLKRTKEAKEYSKIVWKPSSSDSTVLFSPHTESINIIVLSYIVCQKETKVFHKQFISSLFVFFYFFVGVQKVFCFFISKTLCRY